MDSGGKHGSVLHSLNPRRPLVDSARTESMNDQQDCNHVEDSLSDTTHEQDMSISDSESSIANSFPRKFDFLGDELVRLEERDRSYKLVKHIFLAGMGDLQNHAIVEDVHRVAYSSLLRKARVQTFQIYSDALVKKNGPNINMKYAWYSSSKVGICEILRYGFGQCETPENGGLYGCGLYLTPPASSIDSALSSPADENGSRHLLLCRVLLGNQEEVLPGSNQWHPSSEEFDSGIDNCLAPKRYVVWRTHMNTHVLPVYIISFSIGSFPRVSQRALKPVRKPSSPWMLLSKLISVLSGSLPPPAINLIKRYHSDYMEKRITRNDLIRQLRQIAGDKLLIASIKSFQEKIRR